MNVTVTFRYNHKIVELGFTSQPRAFTACASFCRASLTLASWAAISASDTATLHISGWPGLMKAAGFLSMVARAVAWPLAGSFEMWRWVEMLASSWWSVMPGPVDLDTIILVTLINFHQ